nr:nitroreductase family deazaflavin-dependent oxidoreductase [Mycolicibacterium mageritense]
MMPKDRPSGGAGLPNLFPAWTDRAQLKYMNPAVKRVARYLPTFAIVKHRGRKSGKGYETVVNAYRKGDRLAILLGHGETDWVKNVVAAGEAEVNLLGKDLRITNTRVLPVGAQTQGLPWIARLGSRRVGVLVADVG